MLIPTVRDHCPRLVAGANNRLSPGVTGHRPDSATAAVSDRPRPLLVLLVLVACCDAG